jgi:uncharacterized protein (TIGR02117 family)
MVFAFLWTTFGLAGCTALTHESATLPPSANSGPPTVIYIVKRHWHTDIGFDAADMLAPLASVHSALPTAHYLLFGFGDRHYLVNRDRGVAGMLAALWPGPGVVLVTGLIATPGEAFGDQEVQRLMLSAEQARRLQDFVWTSLRATDATASVLAPGPYEGSVYYASRIRYSGVNTCNTWTAAALAAAGLPVHSAGVEFSGQVWRQVRSLARQQQTAASPTHGDAR